MHDQMEDVFFADPNEVVAFRLPHPRDQIEIYLRGNEKPIKIPWTEEQDDRFQRLLQSRPPSARLVQID